MDKVIIVGSGITAMWAARQAAQVGLQPIVIGRRYAGLIGHFHQSRYIFDYGGHVYTTGDDRLNRIMEAIGGLRHERKAYYRSAKHGWVPYPVQDYADQMGLTLSSTIGKESYSSDTTFYDWAIDTFGRAFVNDFFEPFNRRVWTYPLIDMDCDWIWGRVKLPSEKKEKWGPNADFWYAPGVDIVNFVAREAREMGAAIYQGTALEVDQWNKTLLAYIDNKTVLFDFDWLIWTPHLSFLMKGSHLPTNRVRTIGIGLNEQIELERDFTWYYPDLSEAEHRVTHLSKYHPSLAPYGHSSFIIEVPYHAVEASLLPKYLQSSWVPKDYTERSDASKVVALEAINNVGLGRVSSINAIESVHMGDAMGYPIPRMGVRKYVAGAKELLFKDHILPAGRWGSHGYFNIDHCMDDAELAVSQIGETKISYDYQWSTFYYQVY